MNIIICGAGHVGYHSAEVLVAAGHRVTVIDTDAASLRTIQDSLDAATLQGSCSESRVLVDAGIAKADLLVAATNHDEVNLLAASIGKGLGADRVIARVHHRAFFEEGVFDYAAHLGIDRLICPEFVAAQQIARTLRNPAAIAIETFARGGIEIQEFPIPDDSPAAGKKLSEIRLPLHSRLLAISRDSFVSMPRADSTIEAGDIVILLSDREHFGAALEAFGNKAGTSRRRIAIMGGPAMTVWLCRALRSRRFSIRVFEEDAQRAQELAEKLTWATVINADPTDESVFSEEALSQIDTFIALTNDDERNILGSAWVKTMGVAQTIAVVQRPQYGHLLRHVGIDKSYSPRTSAVSEILNVLEEKGLRRMTSLAEGVLDVFRARVEIGSEVIGRPLRDVSELNPWVVVALEHDENISVPTADSVIEVGDTLLIVGPNGTDKKLAKLLATSVKKTPAVTAGSS